MPSTKSQSPGPSQAPPTSLPALPKQKALPKKNETAPKPVPARPGSAGGVRIDEDMEQKDRPQKKMATEFKPSKLSKEKDSTASQQDAAQAQETSTKATNSAKRERRRPRKLNRDTPASASTEDKPALPGSSTAKPDSSAADTNPTTEATTAELEALKSRVRGLEAKVEELYKGGGSGRRASDARSPRRRGKRKGSSATQAPTLSTPPKTGQIEELDDDAEVVDEEELVRLEGELAVARRDLEAYRPRPRAKRSASGDTEYVEEIPRGEPGVSDAANTGERQITLSGSYRIPLPASVSMDDVKNIQSGVSAAQNVARSFLEQRRAAARSNVQDSAGAGAGAGAGAKPKTKGKASTKQKQSAAALTAVARTDEAEDTGGKKSWGEWFGGYSLAISRAVKNIEAEAAIESQRAGATSGARRPGQGNTKGGKGRGGNSTNRGQQPLYE